MDHSGPRTVLEVVCKGSPREVGQQHGRMAVKQVQGSLQFYSQFFKETAQLDWDAVGTEAKRWLPYLKDQWPEYVEEMEGLAEGAGVGFQDILALNVRTEISYGLAKAPGAADGCTALAYHPKGKSPFLAQNWDWDTRQAGNIIHLTIHQPTPRAAKVEMVTEAGIIGKIGLSSSGIGTCLNAIRAPGVAYDRLPVHLALRAALDADPRRLGEKPDSLVERMALMLQQTGVASAAHILIADTDTAIGLETSCRDCVLIKPVETTSGELLVHTNHFVQPHNVSDLEQQWKDSEPRLARIEKLVRGSEDSQASVSHGLIDDWLRDEEGYPVSICRDTTKDSNMATLFSIVMELQEKAATVRMGRPAAGAETFRLNAQRT